MFLRSSNSGRQARKQIMKQKISRRSTLKTMLRGAGAAIALPWLETVSQGATTDGDRLAEPPLRMAFMFMPNGVRPDHWVPAGAGEQFEITHHLQPLASLKSEFILLENLWNKNSVGRNGH